MNFPQPTSSHHWLKQFVGQWSYESQCNMGPDTPPMKTVGKETFRALGDFWIIGESTGQIPEAMGGGEFKAIMTVGFDPARDKYVGSWVGSVGSHLFIYEGSLDTVTNTLPLATTGPDMADPTIQRSYHDILQIVDENHRTLTSQMRNDDGSWTKFMTAHYTRI